MTASVEQSDNLLQASRHLLRAARAREMAERNRCRPSVALGAELTEYTCSVSGRTFYQAVYDCLIGRPGDTPDEAFQNFDRDWISNPQDESEGAE